MEIDFVLHKKQSFAFRSRADEILYGGAAGGGKSHLMRVAAVTWAMQCPGLQVYLFRRVSLDLIKNHMEGEGGFRAMLAPLVDSDHVRILADQEIVFWNRSRIYLCHCQHEKDVYKYQGAEIHVLMIDELTHFTEFIYKFLRGRVRLAGVQVPYGTVLPRILCGSNPGGIGHAWVKRTFVDFAPPLEIVRTSKEEGGMLRQYIPARLDDNPTLMENDPDYLDRLSGLGNPALVAAMRDGDWDIIDGAFFDMFRRDKHVIKPFAIPHWWPRLRAMDWGFAAPFCVLWAAVADGSEYGLPKGALVVYREWYGGNENKGLRMTAVEIAGGIKQRGKDEKYALSVADPAIFAQTNGVSIGEEMANHSVQFYPADNKRVLGWQQVILRLTGTDASEGRPLLYVFDTCAHLIRTLPEMQHDKHNVEDVDTDLEDHAADTLRYLCMTRPLTGTKPKKDEALPDWLAVKPKNQKQDKGWWQ